MAHTLIKPKTVADGSSLNVSELLAGRHWIPNYQRDFVWSKPQIEQLWDDLIGHYGKHSTNEELQSPEGYFLGAMLVIHGDREESYEVVDGQQRLTALSTVISVLYDRLQLLDPEVREGYEEVAKSALAKFEGDDFESNLKFADEAVTAFFLESVRKRRALADKQLYWETGSAKALLKAKRSTASLIRLAIEIGYTKADAFLGELTGERQKKRLVAFFRLVSECVVILRISAQSHTNAYAIFESLNNRGVRLSQADLIKNELLKNANAADRDDLIEDWNDAKHVIQAADYVQLTELVHFSYLSRFGHCKANELLRNVTARVSGSSAAPRAYVTELDADAEILDKLTENFPVAFTQETTYMLRDLRNVLGIKLSYPGLIAAVRRHEADPALLERHVRLLMNFVFRYMKVMGQSIESLAREMARISEKINGGETIETIANYLRTLAPDKDFKDAFREFFVPETKLAYFVVYYLERQMLHGALPVQHGEDQNLEHIMPRTPTSAHWPDAGAWKEAAPDEYKEYLWRAGNLLPLPASINKSIKNRGIDYKLKNTTGKEYESAALTLVSPKQVRRYLIDGKWTRQSIINRQNDLAENFACAAWRLD